MRTSLDTQNYRYDLQTLEALMQGEIDARDREEQKMAEIRIQMEALEENVKNKEKQIASSNNHLSERNKELETLQTALSRKDQLGESPSIEEINALKEKTTNFRKLLSEQQNRQQGLERDKLELKRLMKEVDNCEREIHSHDEEILKFHEKIEELKKKIESHERDNFETTGKLFKTANSAENNLVYGFVKYKQVDSGENDWILEHGLMFGEDAVMFNLLDLDQHADFIEDVSNPEFHQDKEELQAQLQKTEKANNKMSSKSGSNN